MAYGEVGLRGHNTYFPEIGVVSPAAVIDAMIKKLKSYDGRNLNEQLYGKEEKIKKLVAEYLYC